MKTKCLAGVMLHAPPWAPVREARSLSKKRCPSSRGHSGGVCAIMATTRSQQSSRSTGLVAESSFIARSSPRCPCAPPIVHT